VTSDINLGDDPISLYEVLDRVLNKGIVVHGEVIISVEGVELIYVGLQLVLASVETMRHFREPNARVLPDS